MNRQKSIHSDWAIWLQWVLFSMSGWFVITTLITLLPANLGELLSDTEYYIIWASVLLILGAVIAATQWLVLRRYFSGVARWIVVSSVGFMVGQLVAFPLKIRDLYVGTSGFQLDEIAYGATLGILLGISQWFVMRTWVNHAGWWVLGSAIGWTLGMTAGKLIPLNWNSSFAGITYGTITEGIPIAVTGVILVILLQNPLLKTPKVDENAG